MESALVALHMRLVYIVPKHHESMHSGYASEPMLAEAAACLLNFWTSSPTHLIVSRGLGILDNVYRVDLLAHAECRQTVTHLLMIIVQHSDIMTQPPLCCSAYPLNTSLEF